MFTFFRNIFRKAKPREQELERFVRNIVMSYSHGNVSLQMGKYITSKKVEELKQNVLNYKFK